MTADKIGDPWHYIIFEKTHYIDTLNPL
jgi:hypothetical protein